MATTCAVAFVIFLSALFAECHAGSYCRQDYNSVGYARTAYCTYGCCAGDANNLTLCCPVPTWIVLVAVAGCGLVLLIVLLVILLLCRAYRRRRLLEQAMMASQLQSSSLHCVATNYHPPTYAMACDQGGNHGNRPNYYPTDTTRTPGSSAPGYPRDFEMDLPPPSYEDVTRSDGIINKAFEKD